jgi:nitronate monooxygenase
MALPRIIQGGMGVAVSGSTLAHAVSQAGQLGVVSGTALGHVLVRRLQLGDPDGKIRHALSHLPFPQLASRIISQYFVPGGKKPDEPFRDIPMPTLRSDGPFIETTVAASFVEIFLAKDGHNGDVGINLLEKIQLGTLPTLFGAMLAGTAYVLMGAGIPRSIPGVLDRFAAGQPAELKIDVEGEIEGDQFVHRFDPAAFSGGNAPQLTRPRFLAIVSSATLATTLARKSNGRVDGFIVEGDKAGGHNAPPRGLLQLTAKGEPLYGLRDVPDLEKIRALGLPFWLAGVGTSPEKLAEAIQLGATGLQIGTAFAFSNESGISPDLKRHVLDLSRVGKACVFTDPVASPTGFPFKVVQIDGSISAANVYAERPRICDMGYLRHPYRKSDGTVGYRCPSEPVEDYLRKGGTEAETAGRKCVCNGLMATVGLGQTRKTVGDEPTLVTAGNEIENLTQHLPMGASGYSATDVIRYLLGEQPAVQIENLAAKPAALSV